jgi:hypothetical protein
MDDFREKLNTDMKARIKVNIYKTLLEEEKHKNKRNSAIGLSLFVVGIVSTSVLYQVRDISQPQNVRASQGLVKTVTSRSDMPKYLEGKNAVEMDLLNDGLLKGRELSNVKEEDLMKSYIILAMMLLGSMFSYASISISNMEKELSTIGISDEKIEDAKNILTTALKKHRIMLIELDQKELEINKLLIDDPEKNWFKINQLFDEIGQINANIKKNQLKTQIDVRKYISKDDYLKAKDLYMINRGAVKKTSIDVQINKN